VLEAQSCRSRLSGLEKKTVLNILKTAGEHCAEFMDDKLRNLKSEPVEIDECWTEGVPGTRQQGRRPIPARLKPCTIGQKHGVTPPTDFSET
jgi:hypothetical protein